MTSPALDDLGPDEDPVDHAHDDYPEPTPQQHRALLALAVLLASHPAPHTLGARVQQLLAPLGIARPIALAALRIATLAPAHSVPRDVALHGVLTQVRSKAAEAVSGEPMMRARFLLNSALRLSDAFDAPREGMTARESLSAALRAERTYWGQHLAAQERRLQAAAGVDVAGRTYGEVLGWYAVIDGRTTPDCVELDGTNFTTTSEPAGGWPGARHGGTCRCYAGEAHDLGVGDTSATAQPDAVAA